MWHVVLAAFAFSIDGGGLYDVSICVEPDVFSRVSCTLMLFLMAFITKQFKVSPIKGDALVVNVCRSDVLLVVDDVSCAAAALADAML